MKPIICFGQQPCGFFPKNYLVAKINTARRLQKDIGGKLVFFYHDSDADYRETITVMRDRTTGAAVRLNFTQENKIQKKYSPLYAKRVVDGWKEEILKQLPRFIPPQSPLTSRGEDKKIPPLSIRGGKGVIEIFKSVNAKTVADFCLEMYKKLGLLNEIEVMRSSKKNFRKKAVDVKDGFADVEYKGEIVRAKLNQDSTRSTLHPQNLLLHEGGGKYTKIPISAKIEKSQITAGAKKRFGWMQSIINCTHYVYGLGEKQYLPFDNFPNIKFIQRDEIDDPEFAWLGKG